MALAPPITDCYVLSYTNTFLRSYICHSLLMGPKSRPKQIVGIWKPTALDHIEILAGCLQLVFQLLQIIEKHVAACKKGRSLFLL